MATEMRSADELVRRILIDPQTLERVRADPATELLKLAKDVGQDMPSSPALESDVWIWRMVIGVIGVVAIVAVIGAILVVIPGVPNNANATALLTAMVSITSAAIGAFAGLLSPVSFRR
jgi:hypothetical protein